MENVKLLELASKLARKCSIPLPREKSEISVRFLSSLYDRICQPFLEDPPIMPDSRKQPKERLVAILDSLSCDFLNLDLDELINAEEILNGDENALYRLLRIFDNLHGCLVGPSIENGSTLAIAARTERAKKKPPRIGPTFMGERIADFRSASVVYSPRTAAIRNRRARSVQEKPIHHRSARPAMGKSNIGSTGRHTAASSDDPDGRKSEQLLDSHLVQIRSTLLRHRQAVEKRRARIAVDSAKASILNSSAHRRHVSALTKRTIGDLVSKTASNRFKLEHAKEKARRVLLEKSKDDDGSSSINRRNRRLLSQLGPTMDDAGPSSTMQNVERASQTKQVRYLLSDLSSNLIC